MCSIRKAVYIQNASILQAQYKIYITVSEYPYFPGLQMCTFTFSYFPQTFLTCDWALQYFPFLLYKITVIKDTKGHIRDLITSKCESSNMNNKTSLYTFYSVNMNCFNKSIKNKTDTSTTGESQWRTHTNVMSNMHKLVHIHLGFLDKTLTDEQVNGVIVTDYQIPRKLTSNLWANQIWATLPYSNHNFKVWREIYLKTSEVSSHTHTLLHSISTTIWMSVVC